MNEKEKNLNIELTAEQRLSLIQTIVNNKGLAGIIEAIKSYFPNADIPDIDSSIEPISEPTEASPNNDIYASLAKTRIYDPEDISKVAEDVLNRKNNPNVVDQPIKNRVEEETLTKKKVLGPPKNNFPDAKVVAPGRMYNNQEML